MPNRFTLILASCALLVSAACVFFGLCESQEMAGFDWLMRSRPSQQVDRRICIIEVADDTLKQLGKWPLPRQYHATLIKALHDAGAQLIVFDILLSEPGAADELLGLSIKEAGNVLLPYAFDLAPRRTGPSVEATAILSTIAPDLQPHIADSGHINLFVDADGKIRRLPLSISHGQTTYTYLGAVAAWRVLGAAAQEKAGSVPLENRSTLWINYPGTWTQSFRHYSYLDVLKAYAANRADPKEKQQSWLDLGTFKDAICFVGLTATGTSDFSATPLEPVYPMTGAVASVCNSILTGRFIVRAAVWLRLAAALAVTAAAVWLCLCLAPLAALAALAGLCGAYLAGCWLLFSGSGVALDLFVPCAASALVFVIVLVRKFFLETRRRAALERELEIASQIQRSFLPPDTQSFGSSRIKALLKPARMVGGDFYDILPLDADTLGIFIGDVCGKGISAALIMAQSISLLRSLAPRFHDPAQLLAAMNNELSRQLKGRFVTGQYLVIHTAAGYWEAACAGHPALLQWRSGEITEKVPASGPPLGIAPAMQYVTVRQEFAAGDTMLLYTDGWTECRNPRRCEFGLQRLQDAFSAATAGRQEPSAVLLELEKEKDRFESGAPMHDDLTAVVVRLGA